jgi:hypothetical protein
MSKKDTEKRYVVAPGASFVGNKRAYVAGDEIDESAFGDPKDFKKMLSGDHPKIIPAPLPPDEKPEGQKREEKEPEQDRKVLEEKALSAGFMADELAKLTDGELEKLLKDNGAE